uniref:MAC-inhibitory protein n=1 Tax=Pelusios castaneus TaxID=367368 RepID=A0A8C8VKF1_9SAUR
MNGNKTNCVLLTVFVVLAVFCSSVFMLKCYKCEQHADVPCKSNITCTGSDNSCLLFKDEQVAISRCYPYSKCEVAIIEKEFSSKKFEFRCCQKDLCNRSPTMMISKAVFSVATLMTMSWILCF